MRTTTPSSPPATGPVPGDGTPTNPTVPTNPTDDAIDFATMVAHLSHILGDDLDGVTTDTRLVEDLAWDSLTMVEMIGLFDRHGINLPEELLGELHTLGDIHHYLTWGSPAPAKLPASTDPMVGPNVRLVPVGHGDEPYLFRLLATGEHLVSYRLRGQTPSPESFHRFVWDQVLVQFLVTNHEGRTIGLVTCYEPNLRHRYAYLAAVADPAYQDSGLVLEGMTLFISYLFAEFDLRKLYAESLESNFTQFQTGANRVFEVEGRLKEHEYIHGGYQDFVILAIWREPWREHHSRILGTEPPF